MLAKGRRKRMALTGMKKSHFQAVEKVLIKLNLRILPFVPKHVCKL